MKSTLLRIYDKCILGHPILTLGVTFVVLIFFALQVPKFKLDASGDSLVLEFLGNWILIVTPGGPTEDKPNTHFTVPGNKETVSHSFTIRVKDCKKSYEILKGKGAEFITPPMDRGAETRCFFQDPDGHLFEISEYRE